jgi:CHAD domain-containing protein
MIVIRPQSIAHIDSQKPKEVLSFCVLAPDVGRRPQTLRDRGGNGMSGAHFGPETEFRDAAERMLTERLDALIEHEEGTRAGEDPEELHDMRVASRRLRAAVEAFAGCYHGKQFKQIARQTKELTGTLGAVRDRDVLLERLEAYAATVPPDEVPALAHFIERVQAERETDRATMLRDLDTLAASNYTERFRRVIAHPAR